MDEGPSSGTRIARERLDIALQTLLKSEKLADGLLSRDFPSDAPRGMCRLLRDAAHLASQSIPKMLKDKPEAISSNAMLLATLGHYIAEHAEHAQAAVTIETPWSLVETISDFAAQVYGRQVVFIVRPRWEHNYSIMWDFAAYHGEKLTALPISKRKRSAFKKVHGKPIYVMSFPKLDISNALLHGCFAHELGHLVSARWVTKEFDKSGLKRDLREICLKQSPPLEPEYILQALTALQRGLEELIADLAGRWLFGPSLLSAFREIAACFELHEQPTQNNDYYPPWTQRLTLLSSGSGASFLREAAKRLQGDSVASQRVEEYYDDLKNVISQGVSAAEGRKHWALGTRLAYDVIDGALPALEEWIRKRLSRQVYRGTSSLVAKLFKDFRDGIPPSSIENGKEVPTDFRDILNAAWLYRIVNIGTPEFALSKAAEEAETLAMLNRLTLKAIESSYLLRNYRPPEERKGHRRP
jgi:hypothetical protein